MNDAIYSPMREGERANKKQTKAQSVSKAERERERECVCVCVCMCMYISKYKERDRDKERIMTGCATSRYNIYKKYDKNKLSSIGSNY